MVKEKKDRIVHTALDRSTWRALALLAIEKEAKVSNLIRQAIQEYLARQERENE